MKKVQIEKKQAIIQKIMAAKAQQSSAQRGHCKNCGHCRIGI